MGAFRFVTENGAVKVDHYGNKFTEWVDSLDVMTSDLSIPSNAQAYNARLAAEAYSLALEAADAAQREADRSRSASAIAAASAGQAAAQRAIVEVGTTNVPNVQVVLAAANDARQAATAAGVNVNTLSKPSKQLATKATAAATNDGVSLPVLAIGFWLVRQIFGL